MTFSLALPQDSSNSVTFKYQTNYSTLNVNNSQYLQSLTPQQVANLYSELWQETGSDVYYNEGNVGIGTASPNVELLVADSSSSAYIGLSKVSGGARAGLQYKDGSSTVFEVGLRTHDNDYEIYDTENSVSRLFIDKDNGNVGIGTPSPDAKLDVAGSIKGQYLNVDSGTGNIIASFSSSGDAIGEIRIADNTKFTRLLGVGSQFKIMPNDGTEMAVFDGLKQEIYLNGNVGIGTTSPDRRLHIYDNGNSEQMLIGRDSGIYGIGANSNGLNFWSGGYDSSSVPEVVFNLAGNV